MKKVIKLTGRSTRWLRKLRLNYRFFRLRRSRENISCIYTDSIKKDG